ncbi:MAG: glycosyltransferase family 4 protein [Gammaproteobacteria bacterium]|nr:glycosyltransferase family 4 protein [Gammaproteobacteria bacterium]MDH5799508.1 glycosyltransferase family 4 protein [Gammaproteobacteria bacterium]
MNGNSVNRVGYVVKRYPRYSETFVVSEILAHEAAGLDISIFALRPPVDTHFQDIIAKVRAPVTYLPSGSIRLEDFWKEIETASQTIPQIWERLSYAKGENHKNIYQAITLATQIVNTGIEHLHAHFATSAASVARLAAYFADISYSLTAHAKDIFHESVESEDLKTKIKEATRVITVSDFNVKFLQEQFPQDSSNVVRIYNGLDLNRFPYSNANKSSTHIIAVGRLIEKKGFMDLVQACGILANAGTDFRCSIIGAGPLADELKRKVDELSLSDRVFLPGPRPQQEIIELVQSATILVAPCVVGSDGNQDGLPTVLLESMALGTVAISTDVTGIPEAIKHEKTGLIVPQNSPEALAQALQRLLDDSELRQELATQARELIEHLFDVNKNAVLIRNVFSAAVSKSAVNKESLLNAIGIS